MYDGNDKAFSNTLKSANGMIVVPVEGVYHQPDFEEDCHLNRANCMWPKQDN
jgi:hypothetical protein